ncbi:MAG: hypothetical protein Q4F79_07010 [Eubacteriales bacterium]|nr:hypothetical protein [Eubacteriales bacterium]
MFRLFRKNYLYSKTIEPHCAYCSHCTKDNEHQGVCDLRGIVALAGQCRKFQYNPLMRVPPKPARIRGRFSDEDFFFEARTPSEEEDPQPDSTEPEEPTEEHASDSAEITETTNKEDSN